MLVGRTLREQAAEIRVRAGGGAIRGIPEVHVRLDPVGDDVARDPAFDLGDAGDLREGEAADLDRPRLDLGVGAEAVEGLVDRVLGRPRPRRMPADAVKDDPRVQIAEAAGLDRVVGGLEQDRQLSLVHQPRAIEEVGQRAELGRQLLFAEGEEGDVDRRLGPVLVERPGELEHHRQAALHVARSQPDHGAVLDPAGDVLLSGHRVVVAGEHDQRASGASRAGPDEGVVAFVLGLEGRRDERTDVRSDLRLVAALGWDVHELERAGGKPVGEGGHRRQAWHNPRCDDAPAADRARTRARAGRAPEVR